MAVEIHRSGALDEAFAQALQGAELGHNDLQVGNEVAVSGTLLVTGVSSDPDGTQLVRTEWKDANANAPVAPEQPE